jgi:SAM-dependent methyltransferase
MRGKATPAGGRANEESEVALVGLPDVVALLACPACRSTLELSEGQLFGSSHVCKFGRPAGFARVGRWPIVLDSDESVVDLDELESATSERGRLHSWLRQHLRPRNRVAERNIGALLDQVADERAVILVVGGGTVGNGVGALYDSSHRIVAFDIYPSRWTQLIGDAHRIPLADATADAVVVQAVLEHVLDPTRVVDEIHRVLRPNGLVYAETPFLQHVHAGAHDFTRYTSSGHRYLFRRFDELDAGVVAGVGTSLLWSLEHAARGLLRSPSAGRAVRLAFGWLRLLDRVVPTAYAVDSASALYFLGRRSDHTLTPEEAIRYYRGAQQVGLRQPGRPRPARDRT